MDFFEMFKFQIKNERAKLNEVGSKKTKDEEAASKKSSLDNLKPLRQGIGKYLSASLL